MFDGSIDSCLCDVIRKYLFPQRLVSRKGELFYFWWKAKGSYSMMDEEQGTFMLPCSIWNRPRKQCLCHLRGHMGGCIHTMRCRMYVWGQYKDNVSNATVTQEDYSQKKTVSWEEKQAQTWLSWEMETHGITWSLGMWDY